MAQYRKRKRKPMPQEIKDAWEVYFATRDEGAKNTLIDHYQPLVKSIMRPYWAKKPFLMDNDDLLQAGNIGLIQAVERYKEGSDASFETFAQLRINGSIIDEINVLDWTPRTTRRQIREVLAAESKITQRGDEVTVESIAAETGMDEATAKKAKASSHRTFILPMDKDSIAEMETTMQGAFSDSSGLDGAGKGSEGMDFRIALMEILNENERKVIYLRFFCGESLINISRILKIPSTKISLIHKSALEKIKVSWRHISQK